MPVGWCPIPALRADAVLRGRPPGRRTGLARRRRHGQPAARAVGQRRVLPAAAQPRPTTRCRGRRSSARCAARSRRGRNDVRTHRSCWWCTPAATRPPRPPAGWRRCSSDNGIGLRVLAAEAVDRGPLHLAPDEMRALGHRDRGRRRRRARRRGLRAGARSSAVTAPSCGPPNSPATSRSRCSGVNLGRIGFLAEAEAEAIDRVLEHVIDRDYRIEERMTLDVVVRVGRRDPAPRAGRSTRPAWRRDRGSGCSAWCSRSTAGRCRRSAATACWCPRRPGPPPTRSRRAARCCGRIWRRSWWCPTTLTRCSPGRW